MVFGVGPERAVYGLFMVCLWFGGGVYGCLWFFGGLLWFVYGLILVCLWFFGACQWFVYGFFWACLWFVYGFLGGVCGLFMVCSWFVFLGAVYGLFMVCLWFGGGRLRFVYGFSGGRLFMVSLEARNHKQVINKLAPKPYKIAEICKFVYDLLMICL